MLIAGSAVAVAAVTGLPAFARPISASKAECLRLFGNMSPVEQRAAVRVFGEILERRKAGDPMSEAEAVDRAQALLIEEREARKRARTA